MCLTCPRPKLFCRSLQQKQAHVFYCFAGSASLKREEATRTANHVWRDDCAHWTAANGSDSAFLSGSASKPRFRRSQPLVKLPNCNQPQQNHNRQCREEQVGARPDPIRPNELAHFLLVVTGRGHFPLNPALPH